MAAVSKANPKAVFELKSAAWNLLTLVLKSADCDALARELERTPELFDREPVAIDLSLLPDAELDFQALIELLREHRMVPLAIKGASAEQTAAAVACGLHELHDQAPPEPKRDTAPEVVLTEVIREVPVATNSTLVVEKPLRSGQQVYAKGADLIVLAVVSFGAEVIADGSIHVYGPLRGRAIAGAAGNTDARIYTTCMEPQLVAIAGTYRTTDTALPDGVLGKPAQVRLAGEKLIVEALKL